MCVYTFGHLVSVKVTILTGQKTVHYHVTSNCMAVMTGLPSYQSYLSQVTPLSFISLTWSHAYIQHFSQIFELSSSIISHSRTNSHWVPLGTLTLVLLRWSLQLVPSQNSSPYSSWLAFIFFFKHTPWTSSTILCKSPSLSASNSMSSTNNYIWHILTLASS